MSASVARRAFPLSSLICSSYTAELAAKWTGPPTLQEPHFQLPTHKNRRTSWDQVGTGDADSSMFNEVLRA